MMNQTLHTHRCAHTKIYVCLCVPHVFGSPQRPEENIRFHEAGVTGSVKHLMWVRN